MSFFLYSSLPHQSLSKRLSVDLSVDGIFILFPIITLWRVKLPLNLRRIIISAFSGSALTLITGIVFCILGYNTKLNLGSVTQTIVRLASHLEVGLFSFFLGVHIYQSPIFLKKAAVSLTVANLLVIVSFFYRIYRKTKRDVEGAARPVTIKSPSPVTESEGSGTNGLARETSIGQVSMLNTEDRPLSFTLTRFSQLIWSSMQVSEPPNFLGDSDDMSAY